MKRGHQTHSSVHRIALAQINEGGIFIPEFRLPLYKISIRRVLCVRDVRWYANVMVGMDDASKANVLVQWFPTSGPGTTSGSQEPKYGPRTILILWLRMRRSFCLIITVFFYCNYMLSGPCYQEWYENGPWSRLGTPALVAIAVPTPEYNWRGLVLMEVGFLNFCP